MTIKLFLLNLFYPKCLIRLSNSDINLTFPLNVKPIQITGTISWLRVG